MPAKPAGIFLAALLRDTTHVYVRISVFAVTGKVILPACAVILNVVLMKSVVQLVDP